MIAVVLLSFPFIIQAQKRRVTVRMSAAIPSRVTGIHPLAPSQSMAVTTQTGKQGTAWPMTTRMRRMFSTSHPTQIPQTQIWLARRKPELFSAAVRFSSLSLPLTWNATWAARSGQVWQLLCTWPKRKWKSGSKIVGISGRGSWPRTWRRRISLTRRSELFVCPSCTTRAPHHHLHWVSACRRSHRLLWGSPVQWTILSRPLLSPWVYWGRRWLG